MRFVLESGRRVAVHFTRTRAVWPDPPGEQDREHSLVVFCHCAPGAGQFDPDPARTHASDVTLLAVDRPGYGRSDPIGAERWATVASAADDIAAVLDSLGTGRVGVVGWSAGGRVALAVAARTLLLYGSHDPLAGPAHGRWWSKRLPNAHLEVISDAGHLLVIPMWPR